jgi:hypothetical protein
MNEKIELTDAEYFGMAFIYVHKETKKVKILNVDVARDWYKTPDADKWTHTSTINTHLYLESLLNGSKSEQNKSLKHLVGK